MKLLLLAGTAEARELSNRLDSFEQVELLTSLAGVTQHPAPLKGRLRVGGFGGIDGLVSTIEAEKIDLVIDATHPFASQMSSHAVAACDHTRIPLLQVVRPEWDINPSWDVVSDLTAAAAALEPRSTAFLATGRASIAAFAGRGDVKCIVRVIDKTPQAFPLEQGYFLVSRPPFTVEEEVETLRELGAGTLVVRNSGGSGGIEKIRAAEKLCLRIIMISRPEIPDAPRVASVNEAMDWLGSGGWLAV